MAPSTEYFGMPRWRNWYTRTTQNRVGMSLEGSSPSLGTMEDNCKKKELTIFRIA